MRSQLLKESSSMPRVAVLASADVSFRQRVREALTGLRWQVLEAGGGAEAIAHLSERHPEALILDSWLPDLEIGEFVREFASLFPEVDLITLNETNETVTATRSPRRNELLLALRKGQDAEVAVGGSWSLPAESRAIDVAPRDQRSPRLHGIDPYRGFQPSAARKEESKPAGPIRLTEFIGEHPSMLEVSRRIRLVAQRNTPVLIQGPTGSGKELVARALHRLSPRAEKPMVTLNCAAIPESLLEAELFGHTRGAFTGAVQGRTGRIEAAHGGTLFLDEIGEMPLQLQAKLLRFLESGELQRVGDNDPVQVDVRIVAATHRRLAYLAGRGEFRSDLYYRLSVFHIRTPSLGERKEDLPLLIQHFLDRLASRSPVKRLSEAALEKLCSHDWPGNVRELEHVLERATILAGDSPVVEELEIEFDDDGGGV